MQQTNMIFGSFQHLLEEGNYNRQNKQEARRNEAIASIYWCIIVAIFLGWSFLTWDWRISWIIFPCAGVLFGAVCDIVSSVRKP